MSAEKSYRKASGFISQLFNTAISVLKVLIRSKSGTPLPQVKGGTCIVLGNGPSLKKSLQEHHALFSNLPLVCVNSFSMSDKYSTLKPQYYVILDYSFWLSDGEVILATIEALKIKTNWPLYLFLPQMASDSKRFRELAKANTNIKLQYFNYTVFQGFQGISNWFYKKDLAMPQSQNVLVASIFLAINMGFKEIKVVGADHTWHENMHLDENNMLCLKHFHFYDNAEQVIYIPFKKGTHINETFKVHEIFATWAKTFYGYIVLEKYSNYRKCKIYNASEVTFIDAFERKKL